MDGAASIKSGQETEELSNVKEKIENETNDEIINGDNDNKDKTNNNDSNEI